MAGGLEKAQLHVLYGLALRREPEKEMYEVLDIKDAVTRREFLELGVLAAAATGLPRTAYAAGGVAPAALPVSPDRLLTHDLSKLEWKLSSFVPNLELVEKYTDLRKKMDAEIILIPAPVPGSVQTALLNAGIIEDWNVGLNARKIEWVENRDWIYQAELPDAWVGSGHKLMLRCAGLDYAGEIRLNGKTILPFDCTFTPWEIDLAPLLAATGNLLQFRFAPPPRYQGQYGNTSVDKAWKPRFYYWWDWTSRMVQTGIWDTVTLDVIQHGSIESLRCTTTVEEDLRHGGLRVFGVAEGLGRVRLSLRRNGQTLRMEEMEAATFNDGGAHWLHLDVELWWPNGMGAQPLYEVVCELLDADGKLVDSKTRRVGFKHVEWRLTQGAAKDAEPYLCVVNGKPFFLFGIDWAPIRPNFADLVEGDYRSRLTVYRDCNMNIIRVWGGGFMEKQWFYDICDEMGLLVWQEFPLSSSGLDNYPPDDPVSLAALSRIAESYIERLQHHASLLLWCGGNELADDSKARPVSAHPNYTIKDHPVIVRFGEIIREQDPGRRYLITSPYGPEGYYRIEDAGKGVYWDAHGPWDFTGPVDGDWKKLWQASDAMIHSEMGAPAASSVELIRKYKGDCKEVPGGHDNPLWNRQPWWIDWPKFVEEKHREPADLEEFVAWSQKRQSDALVLAATILRAKFPVCGGLLIWMGHDSFPCTAAPSLMEFDGKPRPALLALGKLFQQGKTA